MGSSSIDIGLYYYKLSDFVDGDEIIYREGGSGGY